MGLFKFLEKVVDKMNEFDSKETEKTNVFVSLKSQTVKNNLQCQSVSGESGEEVPSLDKRIENAFPSKNGLYPHEILMLDQANTYRTDTYNFQNFWKWECSVLDPRKVLDSLIDRGFICCSNVYPELKRTPVAKLKDLLAKKEICPTGKKEVLINRILDTYSNQELDILFPNRYYELTELGISELRENQYVSYLHGKHQISIWEMNILLNVNNPSRLGYRDIIWREFNKQSSVYFQQCEFGLYRNMRLSMHTFLCEEKKYKMALHFLIEVISFDLSGLGNKTEPIKLTDEKIVREIHYKSRLVNLFTSEDKSEVIVPQGIVNYFNSLYNELSMSDEEFIRYVYEEFSKVHIHERVFNEKECANIILSLAGLEERKFCNSYEIAVNRLKKAFALE